MLKHGRAGVPLEVMGLMLGKYIRILSIYSIDVSLCRRICRRLHCVRGSLRFSHIQLTFISLSRVIDVFAMPQSGTGVSVESVDEVYQAKMMDMLKQTGRCVLFLFALWYSSL
jgi:26S proteasome regulatory subunit N11